MENQLSFENILDMENTTLELKLIAENVATMKETDDYGVKRVVRFIKVNVEELRKASDLCNSWTEVNPREQNLKSKPAKEMRATLNGDKRNIFHLLNRGISISAASCSVRNIKDKKEVTIILSDTDEHGVFDGLHSLKVILESLENNKVLGSKYVMLEVFTGVEDILFDLARSRNTSTQVKERSIANLEGKFHFIKNALSDECFFNNISWVENQDGDISVNYIIQILTAFNKNLGHKSMLKTYSGAGACEKSYLKEYDNNIDNIDNNIYYKLTPLYSDIFKFVDHVLVSLPVIYNRSGYKAERGSFGKLRGVTYKQDYFPLLFSPNNITTNYKIPNPLFFPILAAMRQLYKENENGMFEWIVDPITVFDAISEKLVTKVMGCYFDKNSCANEVGKTLSLWIDTFELVNAYLTSYKKDKEGEQKDKEIEALKKQIAMLTK